MDVSNAFNDLFEKDFGKWLIALFPLSHEVQEVTASAKLHHEHDMPLGFECLVKFHDRLMPQSQKNSNFVHNFRSLLVIGQVLLVNRLDSDEFSGELVHPQVDLAESTSTEHFTRPVEFCVRLGRLSRLIKRMLDLFRDVDHFTDTR